MSFIRLFRRMNVARSMRGVQRQCLSSKRRRILSSHHMTLGLFSKVRQSLTSCHQWHMCAISPAIWLHPCAKLELPRWTQTHFWSAAENIHGDRTKENDTQCVQSEHQTQNTGLIKERHLDTACFVLSSLDLPFAMVRNVVIFVHSGHFVAESRSPLGLNRKGGWGKGGDKSDTPWAVKEGKR